MPYVNNTDDTHLSPIDEAKLQHNTTTPYTDDVTRLKPLNDQLMTENRQMAEKLTDYRRFLTVLEQWLQDLD